jgi:hypothetical protein
MCEDRWIRVPLSQLSSATTAFKRAEWADNMARAGEGVAYPSFKKRAASGDPARRAVYGEVWKRLWRWRRRAAGRRASRGGKTWRSRKGGSCETLDSAT